MAGPVLRRVTGSMPAGVGETGGRICGNDAGTVTFTTLTALLAACRALEHRPGRLPGTHLVRGIDRARQDRTRRLRLGHGPGRGIWAGEGLGGELDDIRGGADARACERDRLCLFPRLRYLAMRAGTRPGD